MSTNITSCSTNTQPNDSATDRPTDRPIGLEIALNMSRYNMDDQEKDQRNWNVDSEKNAKH